MTAARKIADNMTTGNTVGRTMADVLTATQDPAWIFAVDGFEPMMESSVESRFAISNGFLGVRAARSTTRGERCVVPARTYVAGLFDSPTAEQATQALVPAASWLGNRIVLPGGPLVRHPGDVPLHRMTLDMERGVLLGESDHVSTPDIGLSVRSLRLVSMSERAVGLQLIQFEVEHGEADVTFEATTDGREFGLATDRLDQDLGLWHTRYSGKRLALAVLCSLQVDGRTVQPVARAAEMVLAVDDQAGATGEFRTFRGPGADRHAATRPRAAGPGPARPGAAHRLARRGRRA